jgi:hypothetical protein
VISPSVIPAPPLLDALAQLEAGEAAHLDVLADLGHHLRHELADGQVGVLHERLLQQHELGEVLLHLAVDDLVHDVGRLAGGEGLVAEDGALALEVRLGHLFAADGAGIGGGDVHGDVAHQLLELLGAGYEVGLAVDLDEHADLAVGVDVGADGPLGGDAAGLLGGGGEALLAQEVDRGLHVAVGLGERFLAIQHSGSGALPELLDHLGGDFHRTSPCRAVCDSRRTKEKVSRRGFG